MPPAWASAKFSQLLINENDDDDVTGPKYISPTSSPLRKQDNFLAMSLSDILRTMHYVRRNTHLSLLVARPRGSFSIILYLSPTLGRD